MRNDVHNGAPAASTAHDLHDIEVIEDLGLPLEGDITDSSLSLHRDNKVLQGQPKHAIQALHAPQAVRANPDKGENWWRDAVIYEIYMRSVADESGDGIGDLPGIVSRVPYLSSLGIDALWLTPFYPSPQADNGYDISDFYNIDPLFGTLEDFDCLVTRAHEHGIKVIIDLVPNHTSDEHPWFQEALRSPAGSAARNRYLFRDGQGDNYDQPPNNWQSIFGGSAWKRVPNDKQWYLHYFSEKQIDLNWRNPEVHREFERIIRFWLDRGVDALRIDAAQCLLKRESFTDITPWDSDYPFAHQPHLADIFQEWRQITNQYPNRCMIGEMFGSPQLMSRYVANDKLNQVFTFDYQSALWRKSSLQPVMTSWNNWARQINSAPIWLTSSHDRLRYVSRLGLSTPGASPNGLNARSEQPNNRLGQQRARAMICMTAFLPGAMCLYYGEELGLPEHTTLEDKYRRDAAFRSGRVIGRDGARVPMPWKQKSPSFGFSATGKSWLPQPDTYGEYAVDRQEADTTSTLSLYKYLLELRRLYSLGQGTIKWISTLYSNVIVARNGDLIMAINMGNMPVALPLSGNVIVRSTSESVQPNLFFKRLPANSAMWVKV